MGFVFDLIELESEHKNTTSAKDASDAPLLLCLRSRGVLNRTHHKDDVRIRVRS